MITLSDVRFAYPKSGFELKINAFEVASGERLAVVGPSGCGKTTFIHLIAGVLAVQSGRLNVADVELAKLSEKERRNFRMRTIGMAFQQFELLDYLSVAENIELPYRMSPVLKYTSEVKARTHDLIERAGLTGKADRNVGALSQGERQRVSLCRALLPQPKLLIADEPTANLDPANTDRIYAMINDYLDGSSASFLCVTHEQAQLDQFDRVFDLESAF